MTKNKISNIGIIILIFLMLLNSCAPVNYREATQQEIDLYNRSVSTKDMTLCSDLDYRAMHRGENLRDACYLKFAVDYEDYSGCKQINNNAVRQSCEQLEQLNKLNKQ